MKWKFGARRVLILAYFIVGGLWLMSQRAGAQFSLTRASDLGELAESAVSELPLDGVLGDNGVYPPVSSATPSTDYLQYFEASGHPKFNYHKSVAKRFAARLNHGVDPISQSPAEKEKWNKIYAELKGFADRQVQTPTNLLVIDNADAYKWSEALEASGAISTSGAWSIATQATAVRHGFANTPCAEFQSEIVRESYERAGYHVTDDFNTAKGNQLIWSNSAAVVEFSRDLYAAGWVPWETYFYRPLAGAILMNGAGETPGHTFIAAVDGASIIVDNGAPQGRDLHTTTAKIIDMEYVPGVFFLPPGINPERW